MQDKMLKELLGEDYDQLDTEALKVRLGERQKDFNPQRVPTPLNDDIYADAVNRKASDYYNSRVDNLQKALINDRNPNTTNQKLVQMLSKKADISPPVYKEMSSNTRMGEYDPKNDTLSINSDLNRDQQLSTVIHEMKHASDSKKGLSPLLNNINKMTLPREQTKIPYPDTPSVKAHLENTFNVDAGQVEEAILNNDFPKVSEYYNRGHFIGNDQVEDVADQVYNPIGFEKLKSFIKGN